MDKLIEALKDETDYIYIRNSLLDLTLMWRDGKWHIEDSWGEEEYASDSFEDALVVLRG